jgi:hypothetical protein
MSTVIAKSQAWLSSQSSSESILALVDGTYCESKRGKRSASRIVDSSCRIGTGIGRSYGG